MKTTLFALVSLFVSADALLTPCTTDSRSGDTPVSPDHHRSLANENPHASIVHFDPDTMTIPRDEVTNAVQHALNGDTNFELQEPVDTQAGHVMMILDLTRNGMSIDALDDLDPTSGAFTIQNSFIVNYPELDYKIMCPPGNSPNAKCLCSCSIKQMGTSSYIVRDEDVASECIDQIYDVSLYAIKGPHFLVGVSPQEGGGVRGNDCPQIIAFDTPNGEKKKLSLVNIEDIKGLSVHMLGSAKLGAIIEAEEQADIIDGSNFDLVSNNCVHYAIDIWRYLGFKETNDLALFIIDHLMSDNNFENLAMNHIGGVRYLAAKTIGGLGAWEMFIEHVVYSQLDIVDV